MGGCGRELVASQATWRDVRRSTLASLHGADAQGFDIQTEERHA